MNEIHNKTIGINLSIPKETHAKLRELARADDRTMRSVVRRLFVEFVDREHRRVFAQKGQ